MLLLPVLAWGDHYTGGTEETWHLKDGARRSTLVLRNQPGSGWTGEMLSATQTVPVDQIVWDPVVGEMAFRERGPAVWRWYRGRVVEGVFKGRAASGDVNEIEPGMAGFTNHVTGWSPRRLDVDIVPRTFDLIVNEHYRGLLRVDRDSSGVGFSGRFKIYANDDPATIAACESVARSSTLPYQYWPNPLGLSVPASCEEREWDVEIHQWDGEQIHFSRTDGAFWQNYEGVVTDRSVHGNFSQSDTPQIMSWDGVRAEVLSLGFQNYASDEQLRVKRTRLRRQLAHLKMAGNPAPLATQVNVLRTDLPPRSASGMALSRDDDPDSWPQNYRMQELELMHTLANPYGGIPLQRASHGYLATPDDGEDHLRPAVIVLNGHGGSAWMTMDPSSVYWYGDSFARRGYIVLALDVSHRTHGDDPLGGNVTHPAIAAPGFSSDWEEDGERVWSVMRGVDFLLQRSDVDPKRVVIAGLSMGGEVAALTAAMDTRIQTAVIAGYTPDFNVMTWSVNHDCWQWQHADIREYVDMSDYVALIASRRTIAMSGKLDAVFSLYEPPFAADKQVLRRVRALYSGKSNWPLHYLHDAAHVFRVGDKTVDGRPAQYIQVPVQQRPASPWDPNWQIDGETDSSGQTLYDVIGDGRDTLFTSDFEALLED